VKGEWRFQKELAYWIGTCVSCSWSQLFLLKLSLRDDDDDFLYGDSELKESSLSKIPADHIVAPADDDLFPPIRPPAVATAALETDAAEEMEDVADADADADADAVTGDGSSDAEESDEVSSSALK
jgi:hypothetical protein